MPKREAPVSKVLCWGYVEYDHELSQEDINNYELFEDRVNIPQRVAELIKYAHDEGINEAIAEMFKSKEYGIAVNNYLKEIGKPHAARQNIINGFKQIAGVK